MPRKSRTLSPTQIYHVVIRGLDHQLLFEEKKDYMKYLEYLQYYKEDCGFKLYAYCLMSNHVHLLIQTSDTPLSSIFQRLNTSYNLWFNSKYQRTGHLQQGRYYSEPIMDLPQFRNTVRYIHQNPLKAGLEQKVGHSYPWSSFHSYREQHSGLVDIYYTLEIMGKLEDFLEFHKTLETSNILDINTIKIRMPDDVALDIIKEESGCTTAAAFKKLSLSDRDKCIVKLRERNLSIRQINRLTGVPKGVIEKVLKKANR